MKRYGYKFLEPSGDSTKFTNLRAVTVIGALFLFVLSGLTGSMDATQEWGLFVLLALPYYAIATVAEEFPNFCLAFLSLVSSSIAMFSFYMLLSSKGEAVIVIVGSSFAIYNLSLAIFAVLSLRSYRKGVSIKPE